ncbi:putative disease resistance rpp13-like protein 1, partial [Quercus suber]
MASSMVVSALLSGIIEELDFLVKQRDGLNLKLSVSVKPPSMLPTTSLVDESEVVGRNNDKKELISNDIERYKRLSTFFVADSEVFRRDRDEEAIIELLLSDDGTGERLSVIPIVAEGGMGKTTLARRVYDNHRVSEHFDLKAWAWLSGKGDFLQATKAIVESFTSRSCDLEELTSLQNRLCEILKNKKFLIVLDDVLVENYVSWSQLLNPFIDAAAKGSRIIVTTPNQA